MRESIILAVQQESFATPLLRQMCAAVYIARPPLMSLPLRSAWKAMLTYWSCSGRRKHTDEAER